MGGVVFNSQEGLGVYEFVDMVKSSGCLGSNFVSHNLLCDHHTSDSTSLFLRFLISKMENVSNL